MTEQEKQLLLIALCGYLPYGVMLQCVNPNFEGYVDWKLIKIDIEENIVVTTNEVWTNEFLIENIKPYLRPMSSMTKEERKELRKILCWDFAPEDCPIFEQDFSVRTFYSCNEREQDDYYDMKTMLSYFEFLNSHHFDYRGLIEKGLALEAPEGMYDTKTE